jgi:hypothetical protein
MEFYGFLCRRVCGCERGPAGAVKQGRKGRWAMTVVCDFTVIQGDVDRRIGDGATLWEKNFDTGGREAGGNAVLMFMVKGLTYANEPVDVKINNVSVGVIYPYRWPTQELRDADAEHWYTQIINVGGAQLKKVGNELQIQAIGFPGNTPQNIYDDFYIRDVVIFFQQSV